MVLILSDNNDNTTTHVIEWLQYYGVEFTRINKEDLCELLELKLPNGFSLKLGNTIIDYNNITSFWYRRGHLIFPIYLNEYDKLTEKFKKILMNDFNIISDFLYHNLNLINNKIGNYNLRNVNKLIILQTAVSCGLKIPSSRIYLTKESIEKFLYEHNNNVITKSFSQIDSSIDEKFYFDLLTFKIDKKYLKKIRYSPSFIQKLIEKKFELRVFFLKHEFYAAAIFSQSNEKTKIDFRDYDYVKPNRVVPYKLPKNILAKLKNLTTKIGLDTGSIDLILDKNNDYIFLEVNPVGQFGNISYHCNYFLEQKIAKILSL